MNERPRHLVDEQAKKMRKSRRKEERGGERQRETDRAKTSEKKRKSEKGERKRKKRKRESKRGAVVLRMWQRSSRVPACSTDLSLRLALCVSRDLVVVTFCIICPCASWAPLLFGSMCGKCHWLSPHRTTMTQTKCWSIFHYGCGCLSALGRHQCPPGTGHQPLSCYVFASHPSGGLHVP